MIVIFLTVWLKVIPHSEVIYVSTYFIKYICKTLCYALQDIQTWNTLSWSARIFHC